MHAHTRTPWVIVFAACFVTLSGCGSSKTAGAATGPGLDAGVTGMDASFIADVGGLDDVAVPDGEVIIPDPTTCDEAARSHTYVGCDFWPTVTDNIVRPDFDYAVVVANAGGTDAHVKVTRGTATKGPVTVPANGLTPIYLPWVPELKAVMPDIGCGTNAMTTTVRANGGAYHLTSDVPVAVYQFNAIEYAGKGGPAGKDWSTCTTKNCLGTLQCFSYTNDASLLLPSTALTGNYRVTGVTGWREPADSSGSPTFTFPPYFVVTGTVDGTSVTVNLSSGASIVGGGGIPSTPAGGSTTFSLNAGDVVEVVGPQTEGADFSGSLIKATQPVQVIAGIACSYMPHDSPACDHLEQSMLPAETLGKHYFVTRSTAPGKTVGNPTVVRIFGNVDGTNLTYPGVTPSGAPSVIDAGQVVDLGPQDQDFEIVGDHEFVVSMIQTGGGPVSTAGEGDPSLSFAVAVEQYRLKYVFLAPADYDLSYVDIVQPMDATVTIDGTKLSIAPTAISSGFGVARVQLGSGTGGAHVLTSTKPVGIQVMGYGSYTSYQYPGGLNLGKIAPPPIK
jgi:hypothetical protein